MKKISVVLLAVSIFSFSACTKTIEPEKFVSAMVALGCKNVSEESPGAAEILKEQGVTLEEIQKFRRKVEPKRMLQAAMEISRKVMECHGVKMEALPPQMPQPEAPAAE